jgi:hypothetical protein
MHDRFGGVGLLFEAGLGNVSPAAPRGTDEDLNGDGAKGDDDDRVIRMARDFTSYLGADMATGGHTVASNDMFALNTTVEHPVTNWGEAVLGLGGLLDRTFLPGDSAGGPGAYSWGKSSTPGRDCQAVSPLTIKTDISAYRIGDLVVVTGPGELFGTMTEVVKSKSRRESTEVDKSGAVVPAGQTMVFGQTQDSLGYIIQHFEVDPAGGVTTNTGELDPVPSLGEYEEEFMLDRCFGDHVLQAQLDLVPGLYP